MMKILVRKVVLGTASVLGLGIAGAALDSMAGPGDVANAGSIPSASQAAETSLPDARIWKDDVRWAQIELRNDGLYNGSLDGVAGRRTRQALRKFQQDNGLKQTASLDAPTWKALTDHRDIGEGSSMPRDGKRGASAATSAAGK
ncbi:MAG TPA: peptidoglycan-binding domain-containing protein [Stellaceae bacterium]|nr:peptidoglycan-binding domain-containing protein [Stellaceae bacterium]